MKYMPTKLRSYFFAWIVASAFTVAICLTYMFVWRAPPFVAAAAVTAAGALSLLWAARREKAAEEPRS